MTTLVAPNRVRSVSTQIYKQNLAAYLGGYRRALNEGGTASSKTYSLLQLIRDIALLSPKHLLISIVSESLPHLKRGCIRDWFNILDETQDGNPRYNKTEQTYHLGHTTVEFFGANEPDKVKGPRRDILFINEANNVPWETVRGLDIRTSRFTFCDWNPTGEFWAHEQWVGKPKNAYIHSTYLDAMAAGVLPREVVANIESNRNDVNWWRIYGEGKVGKIEGLVYPVFEQVAVLPAGDAFFGLDFGYTVDVTALVKNVIQGDALYIQGDALYIQGDALYSQELIYETGMTNQDIGARMAELGIRKHYDEIFADAAEPKSIEELYRMGYNIKACPKGPGSVEFGHQKVRQYRQFWTADSLNAIKEQRNFRYIQDRDGKLTDKTTHQYSHSLDSRRYAIMVRGANPRATMPKADEKDLMTSRWRV